MEQQLYIDDLQPVKMSDKETQTRNRIAAAAFDMFAQYGIRSISMDEVARSLGMSKRTLYDYFTDKEDLLVACIEHNNRNVREIFAALEPTSETVLHLVLGVYKELLPKLKLYSTKFHKDISRYQRATKVLKDRRNEEKSNLLKFFHKGVEQGVFLPSVNYNIIVVMFSQQMESALDLSVFKEFTLIEVHANMLSTIIRGVCTGYGIAAFDKFISDNNI